MSDTKTVLVTGGAGFIGSHVVDRLVNKGYSVKILDDLSTGSLENISTHLSSGCVQFVRGDIRDYPVVRESLSGVDVVIHLAALTSVPFSIEHPQLTFDVNVGGTLNLLRASADEKIDRFIFASSCSVCGNPTSLPLDESSPPNPISPYAESKLIGGRYCLGLNYRNILQAVVLRFFNVYGPRQGMNDYSGVITRFIDNIRRKQPLLIYGDGNQTRDFVNVSDVADAVLSSIECETGAGEVINIGSGKPTPINDLATALLELANSKLSIQYGASRPGDIYESYADISKAKKLLGYEPKVSLKDGLRSLLKSYTVDN